MEQIIEYEKTWYDLAIEAGEAKGKILTLQDTVINSLRKKFGVITNELIEHIEAIKDLTILDELMTQVLFIDSSDKFTVPEMS
ncbi:MAG: hypothetical protein AAF639_42320 [Chloroflexota bacterium]